MRWPADHPAVTDPALAARAAGAREVCPRAEVVAALRHVPGRRVATLVDTPDGPAVLKVFASPRARGNQRRLERLHADPGLAALVPRPLGADAAGHVHLVGWVPGTVLDQAGDDAFVAAMPAVGRALRRLHDSPVRLDRCWTWLDEIAVLAGRSVEATRDLAAEVVAATSGLRHAALRPAHRDCHPRQVVLGADGVHWIDLDDAAHAPPGLDLGNLLAHLHRDLACGVRPAAVIRAADRGLRQGYGEPPDGVEQWRRLALVRLAGLALSRHGRDSDMRRLIELVERTVPAGGTGREPAA